MTCQAWRVRRGGAASAALRPRSRAPSSCCASRIPEAPGLTLEQRRKIRRHALPFCPRPVPLLARSQRGSSAPFQRLLFCLPMMMRSQDVPVAASGVSVLLRASRLMTTLRGVSGLQGLCLKRSLPETCQRPVQAHQQQGISQARAAEARGGPPEDHRPGEGHLPVLLNAWLNLP